MKHTCCKQCRRESEADEKPVIVDVIAVCMIVISIIGLLVIASLS